MDSPALNNLAVNRKCWMPLASFFNAENALKSLAVGALPTPHWRSLQRFLRPLADLKRRGEEAVA